MFSENARKRNVPVHLREESWYLVSYEDDDTLRVLAKDEMKHIYPDEDESGGEAEYNEGDIVQAVWLPNGQFYDAKVLQSGSDRNELMKERMRLEKARKGGATKGPDKGINRKEQQPEQDRRSEQKAKKKKQTVKQSKNLNNKDTQKENEKEEKRKKKEENEQRQKAMIEARKAQAVSRWASSPTPSNSEHAHPDFTPEPIQRPILSPILTLASQANNQIDDTCNRSALSSSSTPPTQQQPSFIVHPPTPLPATKKQVNGSGNRSVLSLCSSLSTQQHKSKSKNPGESRRGLHFQCAQSKTISDDDDDDDDDEQELDEEDEQETISMPKVVGDCCKEGQQEIEALRKRLTKTQRRLNIALKAKTSGEVAKNRPAAGVLDRDLAAEYKMVEVVEGSGVFWYSHQRAYCSAFKSWSAYINSAVDIFFDKEILSASCAKGIDKKSRTGSAHPPLTTLIVQTLVGKVCSRFSKEGPTPSQVIQKINMKCVEARRPQRVRVTKPTS